MRGPSNSPSPNVSPQNRKVASPTSFNNRVGSPSNSYNNNPYIYCVPSSLRGFLSVFVFLDVVLLPFAIKINWLILPWILSIISSIIAYIKIEREAAIQVEKIHKCLSPEQISSILRNDENPCIDYHVRAKLIESTKNSK